jgi:hypothetical protein
MSSISGSHSSDWEEFCLLGLAPPRPVQVNWRFGRTRSNRSRVRSSQPPPGRFLHGTALDSEDWGTEFLRNVCRIPPDYVASDSSRAHPSCRSLPLLRVHWRTRSPLVSQFLAVACLIFRDCIFRAVRLQTTDRQHCTLSTYPRAAV